MHLTPLWKLEDQHKGSSCPQWGHSRSDLLFQNFLQYSKDIIWCNGRIFSNCVDTEREILMKPLPVPIRLTQQLAHRCNNFLMNCLRFFGERTGWFCRNKSYWWVDWREGNVIVSEQDETEKWDLAIKQGSYCERLWCYCERTESYSEQMKCYYEIMRLKYDWTRWFKGNEMLKLLFLFSYVSLVLWFTKSIQSCELQLFLNICNVSEFIYKFDEFLEDMLCDRNVFKNIFMVLWRIRSP